PGLELPFEPVSAFPQSPIGDAEGRTSTGAYQRRLGDIRKPSLTSLLSEFSIVFNLILVSFSAATISAFCISRVTTALTLSRIVGAGGGGLSCVSSNHRDCRFNRITRSYSLPSLRLPQAIVTKSGSPGVA